MNYNEEDILIKNLKVKSNNKLKQIITLVLKDMYFVSFIDIKSRDIIHLKKYFNELYMVQNKNEIINYTFLKIITNKLRSIEIKEYKNKHVKTILKVSSNQIRFFKPNKVI